MQSGQYPDDWPERRRSVYQRDNYTCQSCGRSGGPNGDAELHAHHVTPISQGGSHQLSNLVTLCRDCHNAQHSHDITQDDSNAASPTDGWVLLGTNVVQPFLRHLVLPFVAFVVYLYALDWVVSSAAGIHDLAVLPALLVAGTLGAAAGLLVPFVVLKAYALIALLMVWYFWTQASVTAFMREFAEIAAGGPLWLVVLSTGVALYALVAPLLPVGAILLGLVPGEDNGGE